MTAMEKDQDEVVFFSGERGVCGGGGGVGSDG